MYASAPNTVASNTRLRAKRIFPVDRALCRSQKMFPQAHIKIAEGGGALAPRIYFHIAAGAGKVHIGYYGPHRNLPNTRRS